MSGGGDLHPNQVRRFAKKFGVTKNKNLNIWNGW